MLSPHRAAVDAATREEPPSPAVALAVTPPRSRGAAPRDAAALSLWLAARLSLTTSLRLHLLALTDPLKRMRDCVDAMRLLAEPRAPARRYAKFQVVWDTAEAGGCELSPPVPTVDWARNAHK